MPVEAPLSAMRPRHPQPRTSIPARVTSTLSALFFVLLSMVAVPRRNHAQEAPSIPTGVDPAAAVGMLTDATANENDPAPPFMGLATRIQVDPLFGTATSTIPIQLPPGRKGMTPDLTLRYSSNAGNGPFGVGWDLPLGCIKRNTASGVPFDYSQSPPVYDDTQGFVLMFRGGTIVLDTCQNSTHPCTNWSASSEEVWLSAAFDHANNVWTLQDKNGVTYTYGAGSAARTGPATQAAATTFGWYLTNMSDASGNTITIGYQSNTDGHAYPSQIDYGANSAAGYLNRFHLLLGYQARSDTVTSFRGGFEDGLSQRVASIKVWVDGITSQANPTREYDFTYDQGPDALDTDSQQSLLASVSEKLATSDPPPPPTTFKYSHSARTLVTAPMTLYQNPSGSSVIKSVSVSAFGYLIRGFLDVDGDGLPDFLDGTLFGLRLYRNQGGGTFADSGIWSTIGDINPVISEVPLAGFFLRTVDMDGDGWPDVVRAPEACEDGSIQAPPCDWEWFRNSAGTFPEMSSSWPNGIPLVTSDAEISDYLHDLNGDGRPDLIDFGAGKFYRNTGSGFAGGVDWPVPSGWPQTSDDYHVVADLNGDGLPDLVCSNCGAPDGYWDVWLNAGNGFSGMATLWAAPQYQGVTYNVSERIQVNMIFSNLAVSVI
jgi:hypothetical protein